MQCKYSLYWFCPIKTGLFGPDIQCTVYIWLAVLGEACLRNRGHQNLSNHIISSCYKLSEATCIKALSQNEQLSLELYTLNYNSNLNYSNGCGKTAISFPLSTKSMLNSQCKLHVKACPHCNLD